MKKYLDLAYLKHFLTSYQMQIEEDLDEIDRYSSKYEKEIAKYEAMLEVIKDVWEWCNKHFEGFEYETL